MYTEQNTNVNKGRDGWKAETYFINEANGQAILLSTWKSSRGLYSHYQFGKFKKADGKGGFESFSFLMFTDKSGNYPAVQGKCTEKSISELHQKSLAQFREEFAKVLDGTEIIESAA